MANQYSVKIKSALAGTYDDLYDLYGVRLVRGCYEALLTPYGMKDYITNQSRLVHGTSYTATQASKAKERKVALQVVLEGTDYDDYLAKYEALLALLSGGMIHLKVPRLNRVYKLVYTSCSRFNFYSLKKATFTLEFNEPDPTDHEA